MGGSIGVALPEIDARYRTLIQQIPAVVFMAFLDKGIGEAYVSPQIEAILGFTQEEWLNDPFAGINKSIPKIRCVGALKRHNCSCLANP